MHSWRRSLLHNSTTTTNNNKPSPLPSPALLTQSSPPYPAAMTSPSQNRWSDNPSVVFLPFATLLIFLLATSSMLLLRFLFDKISAAWPETHGTAGDRRRHRRRRWTGCGLHPIVLESFPVITGHPRGADVVEAEECAVCLAAFGEKEEVRLLPVCGHPFHRACIDQWVIDHATCPLCRYNLWKTPPVPITVEQPGDGERIQIQLPSRV